MSCEDCATLQRKLDDLLAACRLMVDEIKECNADEGLDLAMNDKAEWLTPGFRAMLKCLKT